MKRDTIIASFEQRRARVALTQDFEGFYVVRVKQDGHPERLACRDQNRKVAVSRYAECVEALRIICGNA